MKQGEWIVLTQYSCGCQVRRIRDKITKTFIIITYCPTHKAAPDMYEALLDAQAWIARQNLELPDLLPVELRIQQVRTKAEGKEER